MTEPSMPSISLVFAMSLLVLMAQSVPTIFSALAS